MNPTSDSGPGQFSSCSTTDICNKLSAGSGSCLVDAASPANTSVPKVVAASQCGNGLKEEGEECDCGPDVQCRSGRNACCDASCKLKPGAVCSDSNALCCNGCKPVAAKTLCRPAVSSCDIPETCDGTSGECPPDQYFPDGQDCSNGDSLNNSFTNEGLKCAAGLCTSRDLQCQIRMMQPGVVGCSSFRSSCSLLCSTSSGANCVELQGGFVDSTPCGYGGLCKRGECTRGSFGTQPRTARFCLRKGRRINPFPSVFCSRRYSRVYRAEQAGFHRRGSRRGHPAGARVRLRRQKVLPAASVQKPEEENRGV
ncbi:MAG: Disintegrin-domain-containing protein [Olpidium bornovanus]|uniref:Disintegrin and metalloproteinase domain-containing protein B n=1 Tax=Olpidium bornovanus TaxID=278681 RepID=A0A8H8A2I1_9FUNG|nr:MAG: Disintegrin-domain-containing protein [Olpidium bornovanus]